MESLTALKMKDGFAALDALLPLPVRLIVGGGGAMLLAYNFPLATTDVDAVAKGLSTDELQPFVEQVARQLGLPADWLNPWYSSFTHVLRPNYEEDLVSVFSGSRLTVHALGKEDLLLMKCFAHRAKDVAHARALVRAGANVKVVEKRIEELSRSKIPGTQEAVDFLDEIVDLES